MAMKEPKFLPREVVFVSDYDDDCYHRIRSSRWNQKERCWQYRFSLNSFMYPWKEESELRPLTLAERGGRRRG